MNFASYKVLLLKELFHFLYKNHSKKKFVNCVYSNSEKKNVLIGFLDIRKNNNTIPCFCFNDSTAVIKCQLLYFNECWLSNVLYTDKWTLIQYDKDNYYLEIQSFSILNTNINLMEKYKSIYDNILNLVLRRNLIEIKLIKEENHEKILKEFEVLIFPLIKDTFLTNTYSKSFKNGITIIGSINSKSSLQLMKNGNLIIYFFFIELTIESSKTNSDFLTTFIIFQTQNFNEILIYYHLLLVKKSYIFQNLFLHTMKLPSQNDILMKKIFQFDFKKSHMGKFQISNSNNLVRNNQDSLLDNSNENVIDLTQDDLDDNFKENETSQKKKYLNFPFFHCNKTITYIGFITKIINRNYAIYEIDNQYLLSLSHYPIDIQFCSLRPGTEILFHNVHIYFFKTLNKVKLCFIACKHSTVELKSFSKNLSLDNLKSSILYKKDVSMYNSIDILYKVYIKEWLKYYLYPAEYTNFINPLNYLSEQILSCCGYKYFNRQDSINEILYHKDFCDLSVQKYLFPYFIDIKTILNNDYLFSFLINKLNLLNEEYESFSFTQDDLHLSNSWIIGFLDTTSTGKFRIHDKNSFIFLHIVENENNIDEQYTLTIDNLNKPILIKRFKIFIDFFNNDQKLSTYSYSFSSSSFSHSSLSLSFSLKKSISKDDNKETQDFFSLKKLSFLNYFSCKASNKYKSDDDNEFLNHFKIYLFVESKDIIVLNEEEEKDKKNSLLNSSHYYNSNYINMIKNQTSLCINNDIKDNSSMIPNFSELYGIIISIHKLFEFPSSNKNNNKYLSFYTIKKLHNKVIELSSNALKVYPLLKINKYYKININNNISNIQKEDIMLLNKTDLEHINLFIYSKEFNLDRFNKYIISSEERKKEKYNFIQPPSTIQYPIILLESALPEKYLHLLGNHDLNCNITNIYHIPIKNLIYNDRNQCTPLIDIQSYYPFTDSLIKNDDQCINLKPFNLSVHNHNNLLNVSDVLNNIIKSDNKNCNKNILSFIGVIVDIHISCNDRSLKKKYLNNLENKLFLKNIGLGNYFKTLILEVRDIYTPDIIKVFLNLDGVEYPFGLYIGHIIRFDKILLNISTSSGRYLEPIFCENLMNTKITCYSDQIDYILNFNLNSLNSKPIKTFQEEFHQPVISPDKISDSLLQNLKREYLIDYYNINEPQFTYSKFICEIKEILEIYFIHKCRLCNTETCDGKCPNQHCFTQNHSINSKSKSNSQRKRKKNENPFIQQEFVKKKFFSNLKKPCDYCNNGIIEARIKCIIEDGTAIANFEIENVEAAYNLLQIRKKYKNSCNNSKIFISQEEFEKYICCKGIIYLSKNNKSNETKNKQAKSNYMNINIINDKHISDKIQSLLTLPSLLRQIIIYGKRIEELNYSKVIFDMMNNITI
ncbi:hypothetical protein BCR32DRAFT_245502 [Anaeromyces robustus]|uniref:CST complex subunit CTC1 n=1 Tax=Anaeromyces robustus TaxID=1754192 RepID=A0A1Y1X4J4_9FUNG|nr:hypothetical protein BCR32DRAFT_245502 [Anaeromyces robustus]|eukprot:ORX80622.1 hypothetical protein BCR32DRAFT_245502 [Anaeromyces robustus]